MRTVLTILRTLCYVAFAVVGTALAIVLLNEATGFCPGFNANTGITCGGAWYEGPANFAMGIVMLSLLSLVPAVLAIAGLIFAIVDLVRRRRAAAG